MLLSALLERRTSSLARSFRSGRRLQKAAVNSKKCWVATKVPLIGPMAFRFGAQGTAGRRIVAGAP